jgi:3-phenylpropionate/trans-cinnamate dioxygenase ferredoxin subunit
MREDVSHGATPMSEEFRRVGTLAEVPEGEVRSYELPGLRLAVVQLEGEVYALGDECTEDGSALSEGEVEEAEWLLVCPQDGSAFDVRSGEPVRGGAVDPVPVFRVRVEDGWVAVALSGAPAE